MSPAAFADNPQQERDIAQPDSNFHIYLCFGQSNMEGAAAIEDIDKIGVDERFQVMSVCDVDQGINRTPGEWYTAIPPLCRAGTGLCPADYFGRTMVEYLPDSCRVGVIVVAMGGSGIDAFGKESYADYYATTDDWQRSLMDLYDGNPYKKMVTMAKKAQKEGVIKGILLHQGETNNTQGDWPQKVQNIYNDLITDLGLDGDKVPLFAGEMLRQEEGGVCWGHNDIIARLPDMMNAYVVSSEGCKGASDGLHFTPEGYRELGRHYAMTVLKNVYHMLPGMPDRPAESLTVGDTDMEIQIGTGIELNLTADFGDGFTENVASLASYEQTNPEVARISNGKIVGLAQGKTDVKATYTDPTDQTLTATFTLQATYFPFGAEFIHTNLFGEGTYVEDKRAFFPSQYGQMGWVYSSGIDMSGYKYLVLKLDKVQNTGASLNLYPESSIWGNCYSQSIGSNTTVAIPLQDIKYTSGDLTGQPVDVSHISIVALWGNGSGVIDVADMYLTNNDDYSNDAVPVSSVKAEATEPDGAVYNLQGIRMTDTTNLPKGIYVRDGKKFVVR